MLDILLIKNTFTDCKKRLDEIAKEIKENINDKEYVKSRIQEMVIINNIMKYVKKYEERYHS